MIYWFGDCLIDAFSIHAHRSRNPVTWKKLRNEIGDKIEHIAAMVEKEGDDSPWAACFRLCGEDETISRLQASTYERGGGSSGWEQSGMAGSSLCSWNPPDLASSSGHPVTAAPGDPTEDVKKHTLDCLTLQAGSLAALLQEAAALQPGGGEKRKLPHDFGDKGSTTADSSCDTITVKAGSSPPDAATIASIEKKHSVTRSLKRLRPVPVLLLPRRS